MEQIILESNEEHRYFQTAFPDFVVRDYVEVAQAGEPYQWYVELSHWRSDLPYPALIGKPAYLRILKQCGQIRQVHGIIRLAQKGDTYDIASHYQVVLVPRLWFLEKNRESRCFRHQTVPAIIEEILRLHKFADADYSFALTTTSAPLPLVIKHRDESDLGFIRRLCRDASIAIRFSHSPDNHHTLFSNVWETEGAEEAREGQRPCAPRADRPN